MKDFFTKIEDYNLGKLPAEEAAAMETAMMADEQLAAAVRQHRAEWEAQELLSEKLLRAQIRQQFDQQPSNANSWFSKNWKWILPIVVLLFVGIWLFLKNDQTSTPVAPTTPPPSEWPMPAPVDTNGVKPQVPPTRPPIAQTEKQLPAKPDWGALAAASYAMPEENLGGLRGQDGDTLSLAITAFSQKKYRQAAQLLTPLPEESQQEALLIRAHAQFLVKNYNAAARDFAELETGGIYKKEAEWYGLLARMADGKFDLKKDGVILDSIRSNDKHPHTGEAADLFKKVQTLQ